MIVALVVNYNSLYILWVAKTLLAQILDNVDFVIVVDNGSTDGSNRRIVEYLREIGLLICISNCRTTSALHAPSI